MLTAPDYGQHARFVLIVKAAELTGYSVSAIRAKIAKGQWLEGREYTYAPDGHVIVDMKAMQRWAAPTMVD